MLKCMQNNACILALLRRHFVSSFVDLLDLQCKAAILAGIELEFCWLAAVLDLQVQSSRLSCHNIPATFFFHRAPTAIQSHIIFLYLMHDPPPPPFILLFGNVYTRNPTHLHYNSNIRFP